MNPYFLLFGGLMAVYRGLKDLSNSVEELTDAKENETKLAQQAKSVPSDENLNSTVANVDSSGADSLADNATD